MAQRRGLGDVLHHFISEEEQQAARESAARAEQTPARSGARCWILAAHPDRPLSCSLALDLAATQSRSGTDTRVLAPHDASAPAGVAAGWTRFPCRRAGGVAKALESLPEGSNALILACPDKLAPLLADLDPELLDGLLFTIDASPWGLTRALRWLRGCANAFGTARIGAVVVGAESREAAADLFRKLSSAAKRQLGVELENFGEIERDATSYRALLAGVPVLDLDPSAGSSRSLTNVSRLLSRSHRTAGTSA